MDYKRLSEEAEYLDKMDDIFTSLQETAAGTEYEGRLYAAGEFAWSGWEHIGVMRYTTPYIICTLPGGLAKFANRFSDVIYLIHKDEDDKCLYFCPRQFQDIKIKLVECSLKDDAKKAAITLDALYYDISDDDLIEPTGKGWGDVCSRSITFMGRRLDADSLIRILYYITVLDLNYDKQQLIKRAKEAEGSNVNMGRLRELIKAMLLIGKDADELMSLIISCGLGKQLSYYTDEDNEGVYYTSFAAYDNEPGFKKIPSWTHPEELLPGMDHNEDLHLAISLAIFCYFCGGDERYGGDWHLCQRLGFPKRITSIVRRCCNVIIDLNYFRTDGFTERDMRWLASHAGDKETYTAFVALGIRMGQWWKKNKPKVPFDAMKYVELYDAGLPFVGWKMKFNGDAFMAGANVEEGRLVGWAQWAAFHECLNHPLPPKEDMAQFGIEWFAKNRESIIELERQHKEYMESLKTSAEEEELEDS